MTFNLLSIPDDIFIHKILPGFSYRDLYLLSRVNLRMNKLCNNDKLWAIKLQGDYNLTLELNGISHKLIIVSASAFLSIYYSYDVFNKARQLK